MGFNNLDDQIFLLSGRYTWQQFEALAAWFNPTDAPRVTYLDGQIELLSIGEFHERLSRFITMAITSYFYEQSTRFIPTGDRGRSDQQQTVFFESDDAYYLGTRKAHPDLAVEVHVRSSNIDILERYRRLKVREIWLWQANRIRIYALQDLNYNDYEVVTQSKLLPDFNFALLEACLLLEDTVAAKTQFLQGLATD